MKNIIGLFVFLILLGPILSIVGAIPWLYLIIGIAIFNAIRSSKNQKRSFQPFQQNQYRTHSSSSISSLNDDMKIELHEYFLKAFQNHKEITLPSGIVLRNQMATYGSIQHIDVFRNRMRICSLVDFARQYPQSFKDLYQELKGMMKQSSHVEQKVVYEQPKQEVIYESLSFSQEIERLNTSIPDEQISQGLYETCSLLKQIHTLERRFPESKGKLKKLYQYYLPILVRILKQYDQLQDVQSADGQQTKEKLTRTIQLINDAMKTIITSLTDQDLINLSADISTLEAVLQKDGLAGNTQMKVDQHE